MPRTTRTFVAIAVPDLLGAKLTRLQRLLAPEIPGARWSETPPFHLTLAFLGDVADVDLKPVCEAVAEASADFEPFELRLEGLGVFPDPARARVAWVGLTGPGLSALAELRERVARAATSTLSLPVDCAVLPARHPGPAQGRSAEPPRPHPPPEALSDLVGGVVPRDRGRHVRLDLDPGRARLRQARDGPVAGGAGPRGSPLPSVDPAEDET